MGNLLLGFVVLMLACALVSAQEVTVFVDGVEVEIPDNRRLVTVPSHWTDEEIYREAHRAKGVATFVPAGTVMDCDTDVLVISPSSCPE